MEEGKLKSNMDNNKPDKKRYDCWNKYNYENYERNYKYDREVSYEREDASLSVQAFINNFTFPSNLNDLRIDIDDGVFSIDVLLENEETSWTAPKWAKAGDIVFFMLARTAKQRISATATELNSVKDFITEREYNTMSAWLLRARNLYKKYGGKILAIGRVSGIPQHLDSSANDTLSQIRSKLYADIDSIILLENPIDLSEFKNFITLTLGGAITPVFGEEFERLRSLIGKKNRLPRYVRESVSIPVPLKKINKKNWLEIAGQYRRSFIFESEFRSFYVNYLLAILGDSSSFFRECRCCKPINPDSFVDNVIVINGRYLSVEVKLDILAEKDIKGQVIKYCDVDRCYLKHKDSKYIDYTSMYSRNCLIIDTYKVYLYDMDTNDIEELLDLDNLHIRSDIMNLRKLIASKLKMPVIDQNKRRKHSSIHINKMDIALVTADAIVNAANKQLKPGNGVCQSIFSAAGYKKLLSDCQKIGYCSAGSAVITSAYSLQAKYIIHAVGPKWKGGGHGESDLLYSAYTKALKLAVSNNCTSIAFPLLSSGSYGYPIEEAWLVAIKACRDFIDNNPENIITIVFSSTDDCTIAKGKELLSQYIL